MSNATHLQKTPSYCRARALSADKQALSVVSSAYTDPFAMI